MNINFELYKIFNAVANNNSISKGAKELMISQPAVTQAIQTLEEELGGKLFIRTPKGVILTNEGAILYSYIKDGMNYFINGTNKFMGLKALDEGIINIGATTTISENYLLPYLDKFHNLYPNVKININNNLTDNLLKDLRNGNLDIVIMAIPNNNIKDLNINYISDLNDIFVSNKPNMEFKLKDLLKENIIIQKKPSITRTNFDNFIKNNNLTFNPYMEVVSQNLLKQLTIKGFGIALLTEEFIGNELNKTLFKVKTDKSIPKRSLGYATKDNSVPSFSTTKFIEILTK